MESAEKPHILVVDDERHICRLLEVNLQRAGYRATVAHRGAAALAQVEKEPPDLIILDTTMPYMSGFEVYARLQAAPATRSIPVILMPWKCADVTPWFETVLPGVLRAGCPSMEKPFNPERMIELVGSVLRGERPAQPEEPLAHFLRRARGEAAGLRDRKSRFDEIQELEASASALPPNAERLGSLYCRHAERGRLGDGLYDAQSRAALKWERYMEWAAYYAVQSLGTAAVPALMAAYRRAKSWWILSMLVKLADPRCAEFLREIPDNTDHGKRARWCLTLIQAAANGEPGS